MPLARVQPIRAHLEAPRRALQQLRPPEGRGAAEDRSLLLRGVTAEGAEVVRHPIGVAHDDRHPIERHVELVGHDLGEARANALTELHFP